MALIKCPECGKEISNKANACPNCGYPISSSTAKSLFCSECGNLISQDDTICPSCGYPLVGLDNLETEDLEDNPDVHACTSDFDDEPSKESELSAGSFIFLILSIIFFFINRIWAVFCIIPAYLLACGAFQSEKGKHRLAAITFYPITLILVILIISSVFSKCSNTTKSNTGYTSPDVKPAANNKVDVNTENFNYIINKPIFTINKIDTDGIHYFYLQEVMNTGSCPIYLGSCYFDLEDETGHLLATEDLISSCPDIIRPGETGYYYSSFGYLSLDEPTESTALTIVPHAKVERSTSEPIEYAVSDVSLTQDQFEYPKILGRVTNNTSDDDSLLYINVIFYDESGNILLITGTNVTELYAGETKSFECSTIASAVHVKLSDISTYKIIAQKMHYQF